MPAIARAGSNQVIPYSDLPAVVALDGTASTPGAGSIITWEWVLRWPTDGSVTIAGANTSTPTLTITEPVSARVSLNVEDSIDGWAWDHADPDAYYDLPVLMPTAYVEVSATTQHAALQIPALAERHDERVGSENDLMGKWAALFNRVDSLQGDLNGVSVSVSTLHTKWIQAGNGEVAADGSMNAPYNPLSAADQGFGGPWEQAIAALQALDISANPNQPRTIYVAGGFYGESPTITDADGPWTIVYEGAVGFASTRIITFAAITSASQLALPYLRFAPATEGSILYGPKLRLTNPSVSLWRIYAKNLYLEDVAVTGSFSAGPAITLNNTYVTSTVNVPNLRISQADHCSFGDDLTIKSIGRTTHSLFLGNVTVANAADADNEITRGLVGCGFNSGVTWTGPADTANFDDSTAARFHDANGTLTGGATTLDYIDQSFTKYALAPVTMTGPQVTDARFDLGSFLEIGFRAGSIIDVYVSYYLAVDGPSDQFKLGIAVSNATGGQTIVVAQPLVKYVPALYTNIHMRTTITFESVGDPCDFSYEYEVISPGPVVDRDVGRSAGVLDGEPAVCRIQAVMLLDGGTFGADSEASILSMTASHRRGRT